MYFHTFSSIGDKLLVAEEEMAIYNTLSICSNNFAGGNRLFIGNIHIIRYIV